MSHSNEKEPIFSDQPDHTTDPVNDNQTKDEVRNAPSPMQFDPSEITSKPARKPSAPRKPMADEDRQAAQMERNPFLREGGGDELSRATKDHPLIREEWDKVFRDDGAVPERGEDDDYQDQIEEAAILQTDVVAFVVELLKLQSIGRAALRNLIMALFCRMVASQNKAEIRSTLTQLRPSPSRDFRYGQLDRLEQSAIYDGLHQVLRNETPSAWYHANLDLFQQLRGQVDDKGNLMFKDAGKYLVIDGSAIEAQAPHTSMMTPEQRARLAFVRPKAKYNGHVGKICYRLVVISCAVTNLPLIWKLDDGAAVESKVTLYLLERLFKAIPDLPSEYLVGDKHYDDKEFCKELVFNWGLQPVFPRNGIPSGKHPYTQKCAEKPGIDGVPICSCGDLMLYDGAEGFKTGAHRVAELRAAAAADPPREPAAWAVRGNEAPAKTARINWKCANDMCGSVSTWAHKNARIYTYLPRAGTHHRRCLRRALGVKRNLAESIFSALKVSQIGADKQMRSRWANDIELEHLIGARLMFHTARHYVHLTGAYDRVAQEAEELDVITTYRDALAKPHDQVKQQRIFRYRRETITPRAPRTWQPSRHQTGYSKELKLAEARSDEGLRNVA